MSNKMSKPNPNSQIKPKKTMISNPLMDYLTSHISLYHHSSISPPNSANPNPRSSILKWFKSLTVHQRQASLTTVDSKFTQILVQMVGKVRTQGHGFFFVLSDLSSRDRPDLPELCFRKSRGLLARISEGDAHERSIRDSVRMFWSKEGETVEAMSCSGYLKCLDTVMVSEVLVENVDLLVEVMDGVSNGGFLRGEENVVIGSDDWVELGWLKEKGYYSMEAFIANKLEIALRLAWLNSSSSSSSSKKRGVKLKEKVNRAGVASNVYWRKKGCVDWWSNLDPETRKKMLSTVLAKSAKSLTNDILKGADSATKDKMWLFSAKVDDSVRYYSSKTHRKITKATSADAEFGSIIVTDSNSSRSSAFAYSFNSLFVLMDVLTIVFSCRREEYDKEKLFYSTLGTVSTTADCIRRKLRDLLMSISLEYLKLELLGDVNLKCPPDKYKEKLGGGSRRKKGKPRNTKKLNPATVNHAGDCTSDETLKDHKCGPAHKDNTNHVKLDVISSKPSEITDKEDLSPAIAMGHSRRVDEKVRTAARKSRRERNKLKISSTDAISSIKKSDVLSPKSSSPTSVFQGELAEPKRISDDNGMKDTSTTDPYMPKSSSHKSIQGCPEVKITTETNPSDVIHGSNSDTGNQTTASRGGQLDNFKKCDILPSVVRPRELDTPLRNKSSNFRNSGYSSENCTHSVTRGENRPVFIRGQECGISGDTERTSYPEYLSYEWPSVAPVHISLVNSHIPAATDRLHLDVGRNWHNHFHQSFVPTMHHQTRNSSIDDYEDYEVHAVSGMDYNQYFGGGVMYWDPSDLPAGFSRPPSISSDDSSWAWHEAEMKRSVDDMVAFSSSYSTNGLTSPTVASFCSPFDPMGTSHQALGYVISGNEITVTDAVVEEMGSLSNLAGDVGGTKTGDSFSYPILPKIIIPSISRDRSRSEFKRNHDRNSPCVPPSRRDQPRIRRPPSPVVLCVPQAPRPPPPSPASDSRKQRGYPSVRSGSSSPRNWGVKGWYHDDGANFEESCMGMDGTEIFLPSWTNNNMSSRPMIQPVPGPLLSDRLIAISQITRDQEHPDLSFPIQPPDILNCPSRMTSLSLMQSFLHDEIDSFCKQVAVENTIRKPYINWAVKRVARSLQVLWPRSRTNIFGSITTGLSLPSSDVDLVVCLPPVRNLEPIKEAGILEGRNGIKETCLQHAARYLANQEWVKNDSLKTVENTAIPIIRLVVEVPCDLIKSTLCNVPKDEPTWTANEQGTKLASDVSDPQNSSSSKASDVPDIYGDNSKSVRIDISFKSPSHTGVQTTKLVKELTEQFPAATPLALVLKQFLADRSLDQSYCGGLSSYCLVLLITRFLQHEHHLGRPINQNFGSLLMDFLYFFGNVFDPRQMRISVQGSGVYIKRERGYSIDPIHIDDPIFPTNNVGRNCFRIHQCIKAFSDAYSILESEVTGLPSDEDFNTRPPCKLLPKIVSSIDLYKKDT